MRKKILSGFVCVLFIFIVFNNIAQVTHSKMEKQINTNDTNVLRSTTLNDIPEKWDYPNRVPQTLVFGSSGDADKLDPADVTDQESTARTDSIFEGLVEYKSGGTEIQPCLATSWNISADGKNITFNLRQGVKFHDGTDFNASAVVFSFDRQFNKSNPYNQYGEWAYWGYMFSDIKKVEKIDNYTVNIVLSRPNAAMMTSLAMFTVSIISPTNASIWGADAFKHPCGTGPFKFVEWVKDDHITVEANKEYWRGAPKLDKIIYRVIKDPSARLQALQTNAIQGMEFPDPSSFDIIKADQNLTLLVEPGLNIGYVAINNGYGYYDTNQNGVHDPDESWVKTPGYFEPFTNRSVRQAVNYAINKTSIVENLYKGTAIVAKNGMPPFMLGYNDAIVDYPYDPAKAQELLTEAGYPNGFNTTLWVMPVSRPYMFDPAKIGEAIQSYLEDVNIHVTIYQIDWSTYLAKTQAGEHSMCLLGWIGDNGDPDNFMNVLYGANQCTLGTAGNVAFYNNTDVQDLLSAALQTYDTTQRANLYKEVQVIIHDDAPFVYLAHANQYLVFRTNVKGYIMNPAGRMFFYPVEITDFPNTIYVDDDNTQGPWDGTLEHPYQHIQDGINSASPGDTVFVFNGTYLENVRINKTIGLVGENKNITIIDGSETGDVVFISVDGVNISGFTIQNSQKPNYVGISVHSNYVHISDNIIQDNNYGLRFSNSSDGNSASGNIITNNSMGIYLYNSSYINITLNDITNNTGYNSFIGVLLHNSFNNSLLDNTFFNDTIFIFPDGTELYHYIHTIENNTINGKPLYYYKNNNSGLDISSDAGAVILVNCTNVTIQNASMSHVGIGVQTVYSENITISNCSMTDSNIYLVNTVNSTINNNTVTTPSGIGYALLLLNSNFVRIEYNNMTLNVVGAYIVSSGNSTIKCNNFNNDFVGLYITDSNNSIIYHNNFVSIDFLPPLDDSNTFWYNAVLQEGNYWSDFDEPAEGAYDNNSDGIVDTPYNISGGSNQDLYPLMYPWGTTNQAPDISHEQPGDGSTDVTRPPVNLSVVVQDFDGDLMDVFIQWKNHTKEWVTLQSYRGADNGTYTFVPSGNDWIWGNTTYTWSVNATDGTSWTNRTYHYTTKGSRYDVNNDNKVNFQDAGLVWTRRTSLVPYDVLYDVNDNGQVNFQDAGLTWTHRN